MPTKNPTRRELPPTAGLPLAYADFFRTPARSLEQGLRDWLDIPAPIITCSGTAAFILALQTLAKRLPGRTDIIVPAYTCPLVALAAHFLPGARIIPCDLLPESIDLNPQRLRAACGERTLAVVVTHLGGQVADVEQASAIAKQCGAAVIEDAAQAMGARRKKASVGLLGDVGFFSLAVGKGLTMYEGGALFSRDQELHAELAAASQRLEGSLFWNGRRTLELLAYAAMYRPDRLRLVYGGRLRARLDAGDETGAVGDDFTLADIPLHRPDRLRLRAAANALERLPAFLDSGRQRAAKRAALLEASGSVRIITGSDQKDSPVWPFFMALMPTNRQRDAALAALWRAGLGVSRLFIHALPGYPYLAPFLPEQTHCPAAGDFAARMLTISNSPWLDDASFQTVADVLQSQG